MMGETVMPPLSTRFSLSDAEEARELWGFNCGPGAICAILGMTPEELRPHMLDFEQKRYTNPTLMWSVLRELQVEFSYRGGELGRDNWPSYGLARVQWEGPWTRPGVPARAAYRHTHWVGACRGVHDIAIFDINAIGNGTGWSRIGDWSSSLVPWLLSECEPKADGGWHITHSAEITLPRRD